MKKGMSLNRIPGYVEALARAKEKQNRQRDNAWKNIPVEIFDLKVRTMTVRDFVILEHFGSPFVFRQVPTESDAAFFFWVMSHECERWNNSKYNFRLIRGFRSWLFTRRFIKRLQKNPDQFSEIVKAIFDYVETIFIDAPPTVQRKASSGISFLANWFDMMQSEHGLDMCEVWQLPLPQLFQRILAIYQRKGINIPVFNSVEDKLKTWVQDGILSRKFTMDDLAEGRVKFGEN